MQKIIPQHNFVTKFKISDARLITLEEGSSPGVLINFTDDTGRYHSFVMSQDLAEGLEIGLNAVLESLN